MKFFDFILGQEFILGLALRFHTTTDGVYVVLAEQFIHDLAVTATLLGVGLVVGFFLYQSYKITRKCKDKSIDVALGVAMVTCFLGWVFCLFLIPNILAFLISPSYWAIESLIQKIGL